MPQLQERLLPVVALPQRQAAESLAAEGAVGSLAAEVQQRAAESLAAQVLQKVPVSWRQAEQLQRERL